jgi:hypothetical protein
MELSPDDMPVLVRAAEVLSQEGQQRALLLAGIRLACGVGAAVAAVAAASADRFREAAWIAAVLFFLALVLELIRAKTQPERDWYDGRAVAETGKSLAWLYGVGVDPFGPDLSDAEANELLLVRLREIRISRPAVALEAIAEPSIPPALESLRASGMPDRRRAYLVGRVVEQQEWYAGNARDERASASRWQRVLIWTEVAGLVLAVAWATGVLDLDAGAIAGAVLGASSAWLAIKQHDNLAESYAVTTAELGDVRTRLSVPLSDEGWRREVADAEAAISREHTMWLARRR